MDFAVTDLADWFCVGPILATVCVPSPWQLSWPLLTAGSFSVLGDETAGLPAHTDTTALSFPGTCPEQTVGSGHAGRSGSEQSLPFIPELAMAQDREAHRDFCWPGSRSAPSNRRDPHVRQRKLFLGPSEAPSGYKAVPKADMVPLSLVSRVLRQALASLGIQLLQEGVLLGWSSRSVTSLVAFGIP